MQVKVWYTIGLTIPLALLFSSLIARLFSKNILGQLLVYLFVLFTFTNTIKAHLEYLDKNFLKPSDDPSNLRNELSAVDWVYGKAAGQGFRVYSFLPALYDYQYQYVFWWYGTKKYGYQPEDIAYLPNQPEYIPKAASAWTKRKPTSENQLTFLIIENGPKEAKRFDLWKNSFSSLCRVDSQNYPWHTEVRELSRCK